jgi:hypothetical protein
LDAPGGCTLSEDVKGSGNAGAPGDFPLKAVTFSRIFKPFYQREAANGYGIARPEGMEVQP